MAIHTEDRYRQLPQIGELLKDARMQPLMEKHGRPVVAQGARVVLGQMREAIRSGTMQESELTAELSRLPERIAEELARASRRGLQHVINASGVILQTNLGRAPLSETAITAIAHAAQGYCNLEYDLQTGQRGKRGGHVEDLLLRVLECDADKWAALVVNNCAAATFLTLNSLAEGGEVIVSRGELVEIGGGFRVPDILRKSGARLVEVGTTNRTRLEDYAAAITAETRLILRVHRSNFEIVGFTERPALRELAKLSADAAVPFFEDQGTGCLVAPEEYGLGAASSFARSVHSGAAIVCASGDKLLGGPQAGLIVGNATLVRRLRQNPLYRALRVDKLTLAALEATLWAYVSGQAETVPVVRMIAEAPERIRERCEAWVDAFRSLGISAEVVATESVVGGGTTPGTTLPSYAVALHSPNMNADEIAARLRGAEPPVIARIHEDRVLLDLRTVSPAEEDIARNAVSAALAPAQPNAEAG